MVEIDQPASISCCHGFTTIINLSLRKVQYQLLFLILSLFDHLFLFISLFCCFVFVDKVSQYSTDYPENSSGDQASLKFKDLANFAIEVLVLNV